MNKPVFVTGGTGLVGAHLLYRLASAGTPVRALKRPSSNLSEVKKVFEYYGDPEGNLFESISWVDGDLLDIFSIEDAMGQAQKVYHAAALVSFDPADRDRLFEHNVDGTANLVNVCLDKQIEKLCYVSSTAAIGKAKKGMVTTEETKWRVTRDTSNYALSKHYAEREVWRGEEEGLKVVIVNPSVVVGPGSLDRSTGTLFRTVMKGLDYYPPGSNAFVDARDVAGAMTLLMDSDIDGRRFLVIGENMSFYKYFKLVAEALGKKPPHIALKPWMTGIGWRAAWIYSKLTGTRAVITRESVRSGMADIEYSNKRLREALDFDFTPVADAVANTARFIKMYA